MGLGISPLKFKIMLESNPLKSTMLVGRLGVNYSTQAAESGAPSASRFGSPRDVRTARLSS